MQTPLPSVDSSPGVTPAWRAHVFTVTEGWARGSGGWGILASEKRLRMPTCRLGHVSLIYLWSSWGSTLCSSSKSPCFRPHQKLVSRMGTRRQMLRRFFGVKERPREPLPLASVVWPSWVSETGKQQIPTPASPHIHVSHGRLVAWLCPAVRAPLRVQRVCLQWSCRWGWATRPVPGKARVLVHFHSSSRIWQWSWLGKNPTE